MSGEITTNGVEYENTGCGIAIGTRMDSAADVLAVEFLGNPGYVTIRMSRENWMLALTAINSKLGVSR